MSVMGSFDKKFRALADRISDNLESRITAVTHTDPPTTLGAAGRIALALAAAATKASQLSGRGAGGMIGGMIAAAIDPMIMSRINQGRSTVLITGTNGKSTTTRMVAAALGSSFEVATNSNGDNMDAGVISALLATPGYDVAALEVDEMHVPAIADKLRPTALILLNLSRDQLDRVGEINSIERALRAAVAAHPSMVPVANCDDVMVTSAAWDNPNTLWVAAGCGWTGEATSCPRTGGAIIRTPNPQAPQHAQWYSTKPLPDGREFRRPAPDFELGETGVVVASARAAELTGLPQGTELDMTLALPGAANRGNAAQAVAAAVVAGVPAEAAVAATGQVREVAGRYSSVRYKGREVYLLLAKNPAGWQEALSMVDRTADGLVIATNGQVADGVDLSWLWDVRFENLDHLAVIAAGERGADLAVRLGYAGVAHTLIKDPLAAIESCPPGARVQVLANYTAFRDLKRALDRATKE